MPETTHIGLTIGPIFKTIGKAKSTRQFWAASYLFSWIMKKTLQEITKLEDLTVLIPTLGTEEPVGAGLYPDRIILTYNGQAPDTILKTIQDISNGILDELAVRLEIQINKVAKSEVKAISTFLKKYLQIYLVKVNVKKDQNVIFTVNSYLDGLELEPQYFAQAPQKDYLSLFFKALKNIAEYPKTIEAVFDEPEEKIKIRSLVEIATSDLKVPIGDDREGKSKYEKRIEEWKVSQKTHYDKYENEEPEGLINLLKKYKEFRTRHKYIAVVQADGDNIGKNIKELSKKEDFKEFSDNLLLFAKEAVGIIRSYNGLPVYAGGDDLLFFAPVVYGDKSVFTLADELNEAFQAQFKSEEKPTLSFGISITYYKYPMREAIKNAVSLLFDEAKNFNYFNGEKEIKKNALAVRLLKHSGLEISNIFGRDTSGYSIFKNLLNQHFEKDDALLTSLTHKLNSGMIRQLLVQIGDDRDKLVLFFENNFDENIHKTRDAKRYLYGGKEPDNQGVIDLIMAAHQQYPDTKNKALDYVFSVLRMLHFLKRKDNE